jgi:hypothetical protein
MRLPSRVLPLFLLALVVPSVSKAAKASYDKQAKVVADKLRPLGLTAKADPEGLKQVSGQLAAALTELEKAAATNGPGTHALLKTAYEKFRPEVGPAHRTAAISAIEGMWNEARGLGAFDEGHTFTGKITKGADAGKDAVFEYLVPLTLSPKFSKDVANIRLVSPSRARAEGAPVGARETAYQQNLESIAKEIDGMKSLAKIGAKTQTDAAGLTKDEAAKRFKAEAARNGDAFDEKPSIILKGQMISTPSKRTGNKWQVEAEVTNLSQHATEVELQTLVIGTTHKSRENYIMLDKKQKLQLRGTQVVRIMADTLDEGTYKSRSNLYENLDKKLAAKSQANYRGSIWRVLHGKDVVAVFATENSLLDMLKSDSKRNLENMAKLYLPDPKDWTKPGTSAAK